MTSAEFLSACASFARRHPAAVMEMSAPELAVDPRARARHTATTILAARRRMMTTAKLATGPSAPTLPSLFDQPSIRENA